MEIKNWQLILFIFFLFVALVYSSYTIYSLKDNYSKLEIEYNIYKQETTEHIKQLEDHIKSLSENINSLNNELYLSEKDNTEMKNEIDETIKRIDIYKQEIETSMKWFTSNSFLDKDEPEQRSIMIHLEDNCLRKSGNNCYIKLGCFNLVNSKYIGFEYRYDNETSKKEDNLQSLTEFIQSKGGDCEDYSLFYKAEYNSLLEECKDVNVSNIVLDSWINAENSEEYWLNFRKTWYFDHAENVILTEGYIYPNIVCGNFYDINLGKVSGHCITAFTKKKITSEKDIEELDKAPAIEPQNGMYIGLINDTSSDIYIEKDNTHVSYLTDIITDTDYFLFSSEYNAWLSYSAFYEKLQSRRISLFSLN